MQTYLDRSFLANPLTKYFRWLFNKSKYQIKYWGRHLRIDYNAQVINTVFGKNNYVAWETTIANSSVGDYTYFADYCRVNHLTIGKFCSIGPNVRIAPGKHPVSYVSTHPVTYSRMQKVETSFFTDEAFVDFEQVIIGNDVWIGANAVIMDGIEIGDGAIIAANSVVTKNVGNYEIFGGVPAKLIKLRFNPDEINVLLEKKWWNNDEAWLTESTKYFSNVNEFINQR